MIKKVVELINAIVNVDQKIGFNKFVKYFFLGLTVFVLINYKSIIKDSIELVSEIENLIHIEKMRLRDELLTELGPILTDFRSSVKADRILYFEYHNSKENLIGIPFKYLELVRQNTSYGIRPAKELEYKNINTGAITNLYEDIKFGDPVYCSGPDDEVFNINYPGVFDMFNSRDGSNRFMFISIPGIETPVGLIVLEWMGTSEKQLDINEIRQAASSNYIPRINALILSKVRK